MCRIFIALSKRLIEDTRWSGYGIHMLTMASSILGRSLRVDSAVACLNGVSSKVRLPNGTPFDAVPTTLSEVFDGWEWVMGGRSKGTSPGAAIDSNSLLRI